MRLFTYILAIDSGFAPNPFFNFCTLACGKPAIRRAAKPGDWIVGLTPKERYNRIVYAMRVAEKIAFADYWRDRRFADKVPDLLSRNVGRHCGDNIYEPIEGAYRQHSGARMPQHQAEDLRGQFVLIATDYAYFGANTVALPSRFSGIIPGRTHRCNAAPEVVEEFDRFISARGVGRHGMPAVWPPKWSEAWNTAENHTMPDAKNEFPRF